MPIVDYSDLIDKPYAGGAERIDLGDQTTAAVPADPSFSETFGAAFRLDNTIGSTLASETVGLNPYDKDEEFSPFEEIKGTKYEQYPDQVASIFNRKYFEAWKTQVDREEEDRKTIEAAGWGGTGASAVAAILDLPSLIPGGTAIRGATKAGTIARMAGTTAIAGGVGAAASEAALQATQQTRTGVETAAAIGSGVIFGGLLGGTVGAFLRPAEKIVATRAIDGVRAKLESGETLTPEADALEQAFAKMQGSSSVGAARVDNFTLDDLSISGAAASQVGDKLGFMNPTLRAMRSPSPVYRRVANMMMENPIYLKMHRTGETLGAAVETRQKEWTRGALTKVLEDRKQQYTLARDAGLDMTPKEFNEAVSFAMRRGDEADNPYIARAAKSMRANLFDPLKEEAINLGLLPKDVDVTTAQTYLSRIWQPEKIAKQEQQFRQIVSDHVREQVDREVARLAERRDKALDRINLEVADLEMPAERRADLLRSIPDDIRNLRQRNSRFDPVDEQLRTLRGRQRQAAGSGDSRQATSIKQEIDRIVAEAGQDYADYRSARTALQTRLSRVRNNIAGRQDQVAAAQAKIADIEASNLERLRRLHRSLSILDEDVEKNSFDAWNEKLAAARTQLDEILGRSNAAHERLSQANARAREQLNKQETSRSPNQKAAPEEDLFSLLDAAREKVPADPAKKLPKYPVLLTLKRAGGVAPDSPLAGELRAMGISNKTMPGLFRKDGMGAADNLVQSEYPLFSAMADDGNGYVAERDLLDAIRLEMSGTPVRTAEEYDALDAYRARAESVQFARQDLEEMGVDIDAMSNDQILQRLSEVQGDRNYFRELDEVPLPQSPDDYGAVAPKELTKRQADIRARIKRRGELFEAAERKRIEQAAAKAERIRELEDMDPEAAVAQIRGIVESRLDDAAKLIQRETERMVALAKRASDSDPKAVVGRIEALRARQAEVERRFSDRVEIDLDEPNAYQAYVDEVVDGIYNTLTGKNAFDIPRDIVPTARGPLKERTFNIPDAKVEGFLENDVEMIARRYARIMSADVELQRKFGSVTLADQAAEITRDYQDLRQAVWADEKLSDADRTAKIDLLNKREASDIRDLEATRDMIRGNYLAGENGKNYARVLRVAQTFNYMRMMGGVLFASLTEVARPAMVHGMSAFMGDFVGPLTKGLKGIKMSAADAKLAGTVTERALQSRIAQLAELHDPYAMGSPFEKFIENVAHGFSRMTGLALLTDIQKTVGSVLTQNRVLRNIQKMDGLAPREADYMRYLGIDDNTAKRIAAEYAQHGEEVDGVLVAHTDKWTDTEARSRYYAAINKDVDSIITTPGVGDLPLFQKTPVGAALMQFKSFAIASNQRVLMRGLQEGPSRFIGGMTGMMAIGAAIYWLKQKESGREVSNNPGNWIAEGLDRSGIFSIGFEINNMMEKLGMPGVYSGLAGAARMINPAFDKRAPASRYAIRGTAESLAGPIAGLINDTATLASAASNLTFGSAGLTNADAKLSKGDVQAARRMTPFASLPYWRWIIDGGFGLQDNRSFQGVVPEMKNAVAN